MAPAEAARIGAVLRAALSRATIKAYALRRTAHTAWTSASGRPWPDFAILGTNRGRRGAKPGTPSPLFALFSPFSAVFLGYMVKNA